jgi:hypothetical protein
MERDVMRTIQQTDQGAVTIQPSLLRRWTDIILALSLLAMTLSGAGLLAWHDAPQPQAATGSFLGIHFDVWSHTHLVSSLVFTAAAASHVRLNWKPLLRHFRGRQTVRRQDSTRR